MTKEEQVIAFKAISNIDDYPTGLVEAIVAMLREGTLRFDPETEEIIQLSS